MELVPPTTILQAFKFRGVLQVTTDAVIAIQRQLLREDDPARALGAIVDAVLAASERKGGAVCVDERLIADLVGAATREDADVAVESVDVVLAFDTPKHVYDAGRRAYHYAGRSFRMHADVEARLHLYAERLAMTHARVHRHPTYAPLLPGARTHASSQSHEHVTVLPLDQLPLQPAGAEVTVLAQLTQPEDGMWCAEDAQKSVALDTAACVWRPGLYTETCQLLLRGVYDADAQSSLPIAAASTPETMAFVPLVEGRLPGVFRVIEMMHPPIEARAATLRAMAVVDPFRVIETPEERRRVHSIMMQRHASGMIAVLSDVHLDKPETLEALRQFLQTFEHLPVQRSNLHVIVLAGNFCSRPFGQHAGDRDTFRQMFDDLAAVIASCPQLAARCRFVIVPGPNDPGSAPVLPRPPIPAYFAKSLANHPDIRSVTLATNPCRLRYFTKEIVVFRKDVTRALRRASAVAPEPSDMPLHEHMIETVLRQGHLCPLPLTQQPVFWAHDHALRLHPLPDVVVVAEDAAPYTYPSEDYATSDVGAAVVNPGAFASERAPFHMLYPAIGRAQECQVHQDVVPLDGDGDTEVLEPLPDGPDVAAALAEAAAGKAEDAIEVDDAAAAPEEQEAAAEPLADALDGQMEVDTNSGDTQQEVGFHGRFVIDPHHSRSSRQ